MSRSGRSRSSPAEERPGTCCRRWRSPRRSSPTDTRRRRSTTSAPVAASRPGCSPRRRSRTRSSTSSGSNGGSTRRNLGFLPKLMRSARAATRLLRELRPRVVVSVGGYASLPAVLAARRLRIPVVVVSYDRFPGRASRFAARRAAACAVAFPDSPLPRATVTGAPVRRAVLDVDRRRDGATARAALGLPPDRFVVAVMGGSQGSGILNDAVAAMLDCVRRRPRPRHPSRRRRALRWPTRRHHVTDAAACSTSRSATSRRCRSSTPRPTCSSGAAGRARCTRSRSPASRRSSCRGRARPRTTRPPTCRGSPTAAPPSCSRSGGSTSWRRSSTALRADAPAREDLGDRARAMGEVHRSGALADLVEAVALA